MTAQTNSSQLAPAMRTPNTSDRQRSMIARPGLAAAVLVGTLASLVPTLASARAEALRPRLSDAAAEADALASVNVIRQLSGLDPVALDASLSAPAREHSCWMATNDVISHAETPGTPGYSDSGSASGQRSNVAVSSSQTASPASFVGLWMTGPFHAVGVLDQSLERIGYGHCTDDSGTWQSAATLDILGGLGPAKPPRTVTFPGDGAVVPWDRFITESPNPLASCSSGGSTWQSGGLPLLALLPESPLSSASATLTGPDGQPIELCVLTEHNEASNVGRSILAGRKAMVAIPRQPLASGRHSVTFHTGHRDVSWSFTIDTAAKGAYAESSSGLWEPEPAVTSVGAASTYVAHGPERTWDTREGHGRLVGGHEYSLPIGTPPPGATAVVVTITTTESDASGWMAVHPCGQWAGTSTSNFASGRTGATTAVVQLAAGGVCVRTEGSTHLVADVTGWMVAGDAGSGFVAGEARRFDSRTSGAKVRPGEQIRLDVTDAGATAVAMNLTTTGSDAPGYVTVWPCASESEAPPTVSLGQATPGPAQAAFGIVPVAPDGAVCVVTSAEMHVIVDVSGSFVAGHGSKFVTFAPLRRFDTRRPEPWASPATPGVGLPGGGPEIALALAAAGMPSAVEAVMANVTVTGTTDGGWLGASRCGKSGDTSDVNFDGDDTIANMTVIPTDPYAGACATLSTSSHVIVDLFGVFVS